METAYPRPTPDEETTSCASSKLMKYRIVPRGSISVPKDDNDHAVMDILGLVMDSDTHRIECISEPSAPASQLHQRH